jgi:demethylmenaquinone methyltransferase/2-methoxy-6-polyprenyl-1,4-benzoquinol methylase
MLADGSTHEVLKNFPIADEAITALGHRARDPQWIAWPHYWALAWTVA